MARLTWRHKHGNLLRGERGSWLLSFGQHRDVATVAPHHVGFGYDTDGWYWCAYDDSLGIELRNTANTPRPTVYWAKSDAESYVRECLVKAGLMKAAKL